MLTLIRDATPLVNHVSTFKGSFAGVYHRSTFGEILSWLEANLHKPDNELQPFHAVFPALADKGYIVRAAFPNLVLRELASNSQDGADPKQVAVGLRWYEGKYCTMLCDCTMR